MSKDRVHVSDGIRIAVTVDNVVTGTAHGTSLAHAAAGHPGRRSRWRDLAGDAVPDRRGHRTVGPGAARSAAPASSPGDDALLMGLAVAAAAATARLGLSLTGGPMRCWTPSRGRAAVACDRDPRRLHHSRRHLGPGDGQRDRDAAAGGDGLAAAVAARRRRRLPSCAPARPGWGSADRSKGRPIPGWTGD
ncbi:MAG: hypothetical protein PHQ28_09660 [Mycobacterium sp.]|nr:hypothetical protein [Mycobacterium sp.]